MAKKLWGEACSHGQYAPHYIEGAPGVVQGTSCDGPKAEKRYADQQARKEENERQGD